MTATAGAGGAAELGRDDSSNSPEDACAPTGGWVARAADGSSFARTITVATTAAASTAASIRGSHCRIGRRASPASPVGPASRTSISMGGLSSSRRTRQSSTRGGPFPGVPKQGSPRRFARDLLAHLLRVTHRRSAPTIRVGSAQSDAAQAGSDTRVAPTPPGPTLRRHASPISIDVNPDEQRYPHSHRPSLLRLLPTWTCSKTAAAQALVGVAIPRIGPVIARRESW